MKTFILLEDDVLSVAKDLDIQLTEQEVKTAIERYPAEQKQDPTATWDLVLDKVIDDIINER